MSSTRNRRLGRRQLSLEALEDRRLMDAGPTLPTLAPLAHFATVSDFDSYFLNLAQTDYGGQFGANAPPGSQSSRTTTGWGNAVVPPVPGGDAAAGPADYETPTNNNHSLVQSSGSNLYVLNNNHLVIMATSPTGGLAIDATIDIPANPTAEFLDGTRLTVVSQVFNGQNVPSLPSGEPAMPDPRVEVAVYDVSNPTAPVKVQDTLLDGQYASATAVGDHLYLVVQSGIFSLPGPQIVQNGDGIASYETFAAYSARISSTLPDLVLPHFYQPGSSSTGPTPIGRISQPTDVYQARFPNGTNLVSILTIDMKVTGNGVTDVQTLITDTVSAFTANANHVYLVTTHSDFGGSPNIPSDSVIQRFDVAGDHLTPGPVGILSVIVTGAADLDESNGELRLVGFTSYQTTTGDFRPTATYSVYVLQQDGNDLTVVGSLTETTSDQLGAVRFAGSFVYLATSEHPPVAILSDPLYVIDLTDPTNPTLTGQITSSGSTTVLEPLDSTHLLGIGTSDSFNGVELTLYDVSNPQSPSVVDQLVIPAANASNNVTSSPAQHDANAIAYSSSQGILAIPVAGGLSASGQVAGTSTEDYVYHVDFQTGFHFLGAVTHDSEVERSVLQNGFLYSIAQQSVQVHALNNLGGSGTEVGLSTGTFLSRLYNVLLSRNIEPSALGFWGAELAQGISRGAVIQFIMNSSEYERPQIAAMYQQLLGRSTSNQEIDPWMQYLAAGHSLQDIRLAILDSPEYFRNAGSQAGLVSDLYRDILGRNADAAGALVWLHALQTNVPPTNVVTDFLESAEAAAYTVALDYQTYLLRSADTAGSDYFVSALLAGRSEKDIAISILGSEEFFMGT